MNTQRYRILSGAALAVTVVLIGAGCKTAHITRASSDPDALHIAKTDTILVKSFDASNAVFKGDFSEVGVLNDADRQRISQTIATATLDRLTQNGYSAQAFTTNGAAEALLVEGTVTEVDKGSHSKRFLVGMGAGAASIKANVFLRRIGNSGAPAVKLEMAGKGGITGGMWANQDWIGIYSASLVYTIADFLMGKHGK